jgi:hypothetical protein
MLAHNAIESTCLTAYTSSVLRKGIDTDQRHASRIRFEVSCNAALEELPSTPAKAVFTTSTTNDGILPGDMS